MNPNKKRVGLNPKQIEVMEQIRLLSDVDVAKGARIAKKKLGLKKCYPVLDTSLDADLYLPDAIASAGWCSSTIKRYTAYFLGIARKKDEAARDARLRYKETPHVFAPTVYGEDGKVLPQWSGIKWGKTNGKAHRPPMRLISERVLIFLVLGLAIVKGSTEDKARKNAARDALWKALGIRPATVVPISDDDELVFWNSVTTPVADPATEVPPSTQGELSFPDMGDVDAAVEAFGASPLNGGQPPVSVAEFLSVEEEEEDPIAAAEDLVLQGLEMLQQGIHALLKETRNARKASQRSSKSQERLKTERAKLDARARELDKREKSMRDKEAVLAQVFRVAEGLRAK